MTKQLILTERRRAVKLGLYSFIGEQCKYCAGTFDTIESLENAVWAGEGEDGRCIAHEQCWNERKRG